jgi:hypothetical protein
VFITWCAGRLSSLGNIAAHSLFDDLAVLDVFQINDNFGDAVGGAAGGFDDFFSC